ncbi:MAG: molybdopterin molybdotransferase MoeA [Limisphaera sp.]|nr:molybdopterin molybdotransferase MoeA [Limisphaera sp.]
MTSSTTQDWTADAVRRLLVELCPPLPAETVPLPAALGRRLRQAVLAPEDLPPFDRSAMDGFAIRWDDPGPRFQIVDRLRAGDWRPRQLQPGQAVAIATGAALPAADLQVVPREFVEEHGDTILLRSRPAERFIRRRGEDAPAGSLLAPAGTLVGPGTLALLASVGHVQPTVTRRPRVWHLVTGNELVEPARSPNPGQIRDSNSTLVRAFLARWNIEPLQLRLPEDEHVALAALEPIRRQSEPVDLLLISGGASVGPHDFTRRLLEQCGYEILLHKIRTRPGRPLIVARRGPALAFGLPGNPLAHFVCLHLYVRTALLAWDGARPVPEPWQTATLADSLPGSTSAHEVFWPARWELDPDGRARIVPLRWQSSGDLTALATANALLRVPAETVPPQAGSRVAFLPEAPV